MKQTKEQSRLRIIAGKWRSRFIVFSQTPELRPTSNRIRETLFNWLQNHVTGEDCLDLFAGSGACGFEALSRGARQVVFVEKNRIAANMINANLNSLNAGSNSVLCADVNQFLSASVRAVEQQFGLVFVDPPYAANLELETCHKLEASNRLKPSALIYLESDKSLLPECFPQNWTMKKEKKAGAVNYYLMERLGPDERLKKVCKEEYKEEYKEELNERLGEKSTYER